MTSEEAAAVDRREALKKLAAGGAVAAGATAVLSSTAFANPGTQNCAAGGSYAVSATFSGSTATLTATPASVSCPCGTSTPASTTFAWVLDLTTGAGNSIAKSLGNGNKDWTLTVTVRCRDRKSRLVCATSSFTGIVKVNGGTDFTGGSTTNLTYSSAPCT